MNTSPEKLLASAKSSAEARVNEIAAASDSVLSAVEHLTALNLNTGGLSSDPDYLNLIEDDPLAFTDADSRALTRELDRGWDRFGAELPGLTVPTLAVHGAIDPFAAPGAVRAYAEQIPALQYREFPGTRHDVLNDITHAEVTATIVGFIDHTVGN